MLRSFFWVVLVTLSGLLFDCQPGWCQGTQKIGGVSALSADEIHDFHSPDDELLITGRVEKLEGGTVTIQDEGGRFAEFKLTDFCDEDRRFIRREIARIRKFEQDEAEAKQVLRELGGIRGTAPDLAQQIRLCNQLRKLGMAANSGDRAMRALFDHPDQRMQRAAVLAYLAICDPIEINYEEIMEEMRTEQWGFRAAFEGYPDDLFEGLIRFREQSLPYLQHAAYTGRLKLTSEEPRVTAEPEEFVVVDETRNQIRAAACEAIGQLGDPQGVNVLLDLLPVVERPKDETRDQKTLKSIIEALGQLGSAPDEVVAAFQRLEQEFPDEIAEAKDEIRKKIRERERRDDD